MRVTVTGGLGYIGACVVEELTDGGHDVRVLDSLLHGQEDVAAHVTRLGAEIVRGDVRDAARRAGAFEGADAVVHLAAIVGDPACAARSRAVSTEVNVERQPQRSSPDAQDAGVRAACLRLHLLQLRPHGRPDGADHRGRRARARSRCTPSRRSASSRRCWAASFGDVAADLPALRDRLRRGPAHALRPHGQRVHARPLGRPGARGLRRAVLAPLRARARRRARACAPCSTRRIEQGRRRGLQRRPLGRELPQARPRRG